MALPPQYSTTQGDPPATPGMIPVLPPCRPRHDDDLLLSSIDEAATACRRILLAAAADSSMDGMRLCGGGGGGISRGRIRFPAQISNLILNPSAYSIEHLILNLTLHF